MQVKKKKEPLSLKEKESLALLQKGEMGDPHTLLGLHEGRARLWHPGATQLFVEVKEKLQKATLIDPSGLFEVEIGPMATYGDYRLYHPSSLLSYDPYSFVPTFGPTDLYLFSQGTHYQLHKKMGGRLCEHQGVLGASFVLFAPNAKAVSLVGDFNGWQSGVSPMRALNSSGVWELFVPGLQEGERYKFELLSAKKERLLKSDPYALRYEQQPHSASILVNPESFKWSDESFRKEQLEKKEAARPMNIYEVHLGSWRKRHLWEYTKMGEELADYCVKMGFTHVELMPPMEHPFDPSWGYQVTGFFAPTSRFGSFSDFQKLVNQLHRAGIGVIIDWVPGHFPSDEFALARFDGSALYEHEDPRQGFHPHWNTYIFNYGRKEVSNFLIASALSWIEWLHIDGIRVDAVASMLYLDYGRENGEWVANEHGRNENIEAIEFLKHFNSIVHQRHPAIYTFAEESSSFIGVTHKQGLGFDMKWNMGWMNDTLRYISREPIHRSYHQNELTFGQLYAYTEKFTLPLSHDEVVHGKRSLLNKMPGDHWQKRAGLRLLYSYMICQPGKKLIFMGAELAQWKEWDHDQELDWCLLSYPEHQGMQDFFKEMNHFYLHHRELWEKDFDRSGFEWVDHRDHQNSVISYLRKSERGALLCIHNFTPKTHDHYELRLPKVRVLKELFSSDESRFGGSGKTQLHSEILDEEKVLLQLPPLGTVIFKVEFYG